MKIYFFLLSILTITLVSCSDQEAEIPSYIHVESLDLITEYDEEGSDKHKFTDVWVTIGGQFIGAFELPCQIPVLMQGEHEVHLRAGIKVNGISATRSAYTILQNCKIKNIDGEFISKITLNPGEITYFNGEVEYKKDINFVINETFEGAGDLLIHKEFSNIEDGDTVVYTSTLEEVNDEALVYEGEKSGFVHLTKELNTVLIEPVKNGFDVPKNGFNYIELDYKTDVLLRLGIKYNDASGTQDERHFLRPTDGEWKKVYLNIVPESAKDPQAAHYGATKYRPYITAHLTEDMEEGFIYLDNYKLIHGNE